MSYQNQHSLSQPYWNFLPFPSNFLPTRNLSHCCFCFHSTDLQQYNQKCFLSERRKWKAKHFFHTKKRTYNPQSTTKKQILSTVSKGPSINHVTVTFWVWPSPPLYGTVTLFEKKISTLPPSRHGFYFVVSRHFYQFCFCRPPVTTRFCIFSESLNLTLKKFEAFWRPTLKVWSKWADMFLISNLILISIVILYITIDHQNRKESFTKLRKKFEKFTNNKICNDNGNNNRIVIEMIYSQVHTYLIKKSVTWFSDLTYPPPRVTVPSRFLKNKNDPSPPPA